MAAGIEEAVMMEDLVCCDEVAPRLIVVRAYVDFWDVCHRFGRDQGIGRKEEAATTLGPGVKQIL